MPRPKTKDRWNRRIREIRANNPELSAAAISRKLQQEATNEEKPPSARTIKRIMQAFDPLPASDKLPYRYCSWPQSFQDRALPWEASRPVLDLLRFRVELGMNPPLISEAQWFYRISIVVGIVSNERFDMKWKSDRATHLASLEMAGDIAGVSEQLTGFQWLFAFQPWRSKEDDEAYQAAIREKKIPSPADEPLVMVPAHKMVGLEPKSPKSEVIRQFLRPKKSTRKRKGAK
jgi:hypothetical protein